MERLTEERVDELLAAAGRARVLVVGDLMLDRYIAGAVERVSPEAPVPVVKVERESSAVGGAGNVAANVAALDASCHVVGVAGRDEAGEAMRAALERLGVRTEGLVRTDARPTTVKTRVLARRQQVVRFDHEVDVDANGSLAETLADTVEALALRSDVLVLEDYNKGVLVPPVVARALEVAAERGLPSVVDPKRRNFFAYGGATVFKPNAKELEDALGAFIHPGDAEWMEATRRNLGARHLLLTLGEEGMALQTEGGELVRVPTVARGVYDVSGAGDTVTAVVAVMLAAGASVEEAAMLANHAAAIEVGKPGVATVSPDELRAQVRAFHAER
ncbi:MAG: PfkB family carbohydrate kinase [Gemmatimonadota bacterium]|nr:PfkB family carbohydrate kinase [Gemmatimonadota bacterium]